MHDGVCVEHVDLAQDGRVVKDDCIRDHPRALIADLNFDVGSPGQLLLASNLGDSRAMTTVFSVYFWAGERAVLALSLHPVAKHMFSDRLTPNSNHGGGNFGGLGLHPQKDSGPVSGAQRAVAAVMQTTIIDILKTQL